MRADLLEFADIVIHLLGRRHHRPEIPDLVAPNIQESGSVRCEQPFVQTGGVVITAQVVVIEVEVCECVCAIDDDRDAVATGHFHDLAHGQYLPGDVDRVAHQDEPRQGNLFSITSKIARQARWRTGSRCDPSTCFMV